VVPELSCPAVKLCQTHTEAVTKLAANSQTDIAQHTLRKNFLNATPLPVAHPFLSNLRRRKEKEEMPYLY